MKPQIQKENIQINVETLVSMRHLIDLLLYNQQLTQINDNDYYNQHQHNQQQLINNNDNTSNKNELLHLIEELPPINRLNSSKILRYEKVGRPSKLDGLTKVIEALVDKNVSVNNIVDFLKEHAHIEITSMAIYAFLKRKHIQRKVTHERQTSLAA